ncbi:MAG: flotillin family protein, partial [Clostridia bacterium]|nr:flotillin family protein [Clostridia bacterium]
SVAEAERVGAIGSAEAERDRRISVSKSNSEAITGENEAKALIAESDASRREKEAEAQKRAVAAENIAKARAEEESYEAKRAAEEARAHFEQAKLEADVIIKTEIEKKKLELEAEAQAEQIRRRAKGEADATLLKMQAEANGAKEILMKQAEGFRELVQSAGGEANDAIRLMIADKLEEVTRIQVEAIKNLQIDKITVWDSGAKSDGGKGTTADFISGLYKSVPPLTELFDMAGMQLPEYLGTPKTDANAIEAPSDGGTK